MFQLSFLQKWFFLIEYQGQSKSATTFAVFWMGLFLEQMDPSLAKTYLKWCQVSR